MKIVIDISEEEYELVRHGNKSYTTELELMNAVADGTPLPKGHGRLIDADAFQRYCFNKNFDKRLSEGGLATINMFLEFQPTIIEGSDSE